MKGFGADIFEIPESLYVDADGSFWVTDMGSNSVIHLADGIVLHHIKDILSPIFATKLSNGKLLVGCANGDFALYDGDIKLKQWNIPSDVILFSIENLWFL